VISVSVSPSSEEFIAGSRKGAILIYKRNGIMREVSSTYESICETTDLPGGINEIQFAVYGSVFFATCHSGFCYGVVYPQKVSTGTHQIEVLEECKLKICDNLLQMNDIYVTPEPVIGLYVS
jgi:hypothetical protein